MDYTFHTVDLKTELVGIIKKELPKFNFGNVKVIRADPQSATELPCVGINRIDDGETNNQIADAVDTYYDKESKTNYTVFGSYFQETLEIRVWHTNADERDRLYQHVKAILFASRQGLVAKGIINLSLRSGKDEQDSSMAQAPMVLYWAPITLSCMNPLNVTFEEHAETIVGMPIHNNLTEG